MLDPRAKRLPIDELGDDERSGVQIAEVVDDHDVRMVQARGCARFLVEAPQTFLVHCEFRREEFERDRAIQLAVVRQVHFTHPARAKT